MSRPRAFISYRRKTSAMLATLIAHELEGRSIEAFVDTRRTDGGGPFPDRLLRAIEGADVFVCLLAEGTFDSDWVKREIEHAHTMGKVLIPVFQETYLAPSAPDTHIHALLQSDGVHVMDVKNIYVDEAINQLAEMIRRSVPVKRSSRRPLWGAAALGIAALGIVALIASGTLGGGGTLDAAGAIETLTAAARQAAILSEQTATAGSYLATAQAQTLVAGYLLSTAEAETQVAMAATATPTNPLTPTSTLTATATLSTTPSPTTPPTPTATASPDPVTLARAFRGSNVDWQPVTATIQGIAVVLVPSRCVGPVCSEPFWISRTEITNADYQRCVDAGLCTRPVYGTENMYAADLPVVGLSWQAVNTYLDWLGADLPDTTMWTYAAAGPDGRQYPWGDAPPDLNHLNYNMNVGRATPVGTYSPQGDSWVGAADMAGNVWEWVLATPGVDRHRVNPVNGSALRGGSWLNGPVDASTTYADPYTTDYGQGLIGLRVWFPVEAATGNTATGDIQASETIPAIMEAASPGATIPS